MLVEEGFAQQGWVIVLASDSWRSGSKLDPIDLAFRIHEGLRLTGEPDRPRHPGRPLVTMTERSA